MKPIEIAIIVLAVLIVASVLAYVIYRKIKDKKEGCHTCIGCSHAKECSKAKKDKLLAELKAAQNDEAEQERIQKSMDEKKNLQKNNLEK